MCVHPCLQFEGVAVVGAGGEVSVHHGAPTEGPPVRQLILLPILGPHTLSVAVGGVGGPHSLATYTQPSRDRGQEDEVGAGGREGRTGDRGQGESLFKLLRGEEMWFAPTNTDEYSAYT